MESIKTRLNINNIPRHVAIIMDGNGRWAKKRGFSRIYGHKHAIRAIRSTVEGAGEIGLKFLTLYTFSTENWERPKFEVEALMNLMVNTIEAETESLKENNVRLMVIGDVDQMPENVQIKLNTCCKILKQNTGLNLVLALSYSSRWEIIQAVKKIVQDSKNDKIKPGDINDNLFGQYLTTSEIPDPELLIRTSGEKRISNFLLWQIVYTELYFTDTLWPDFRKEDLFKAVFEYQKRERRFGKTSEQISS